MDVALPDPAGDIEYLNGFADKYDLRRTYRFNTKVTATHFDERTGLWRVTTDRGERLQLNTW